MTTATNALNRFITLDPSRGAALHVQIRRALRELIVEHFSDGEKFFTEPELVDRLKVSRGTIRRALMDLTSDGLLIRQPAKGTFVRKVAKAEVIPTIGIFVPDWQSAYFTQLLDGISAVCRQRHYRLQIYHTDRGENTAQAYRFVDRPPTEERIILLGNAPRVTQEIGNALGDRGYRTVCIGSPAPGYSGPLLGIDNAAAVRTSLDHLQSLGHRRIIYLVNEPGESGNVIERLATFDEECRARGLSEAKVVHCHTKFFDDSYEKAYSKMEEAMALAPTAIFTHSDPGAWAALRWCTERGIRVPEELSIMGFGDDRPSRFTYPTISSQAHPVTEIARQAIDLLLEESAGVRETRMVCTLVARESTGPAPASIA